MLQHVVRSQPHASISRSRGLLLRTLKTSSSLLRPKKTRTSPATIPPTVTVSKPIAIPYAHPSSPGQSKNVQHGASSDEFERSFDALRTAVNNMDAPSIQKHWEILTSPRFQEMFIPLRYHELAEDIAALPWTRHPLKVLEPCAHLLEQITVTAAGSGFPRGLLAIMASHLLSQDSDSLYRVYHRFRTSSSDEGERSLDDVKVEDEDSVLDGFISQPDNQSQEDDIPDEPAHFRDKLQAEMLIYFIAASALRDNFHEALHAVVQARTTLTGGYVRTFLARLGDDFPPRVKIELFLRRAVTANLLSRPTSLTNHIQHLITNTSSLTLWGICEDIFEGLTHSDPWLTVDQASLSEKTPVSVPNRAFPLLLYGLMKCERLDLAGKWWEDMETLGLLSSSSVWKALLMGYNALHMANEAVNTWSLMLQRGITPDPQFYREIILLLFRSRRKQDALKRYQDFLKDLEKGKFQDKEEARTVFSAVIYQLLHRGDENGAKAILEQMQANGVTPHIHIVNNLLAYYGKRRKLKAFGETLQMISTFDLAPQPHTYSILLTALLPVREDAVSVVFDFMQKHGKAPNAHMYTTLITALLEEQTMAAFQTALRLLQEMEASKSPEARPNSVTYTAFLTGIHRSSWMDPDTAEEYIALISKKMAKQRLMHNLVSYHILMKVCLDSPGPEGLRNAMRYYREMKRRRIPTISNTWFIILLGLMKRQEWELADTVVEDLKQSGIRIPSALAHLTRVNDTFCESEYFIGLEVRMRTAFHPGRMTCPGLIECT
ncbi:hypothetical protein BDW22DRAFT_1350591 [Trametopsis cervina]|nr:hypothetical protein BDW22DRAFT_1350591 [Trametopsis cervina]